MLLNWRSIATIFISANLAFMLTRHVCFNGHYKNICNLCIIEHCFTCFVQLMILVDDAGDFLPSINHSPWNGVTLADFVMPFFLFIVGVALALAYKVSLPYKAQISCQYMLMSKNYICI